MKIVAKSILYLFLELVLFVAIYSWGNILFGQVGEVDACITPEYGEFELDYLAFGWSNYFHWFRADENLACRFTSFDTWAFFIPLIIFYTGLKGYGSKRWHKSVTWQIIIPEICIYLFVYLAFLFNQSGFIMTTGSFLNATLGAIMFGLPLIVYAFFIALANSRYISKNKSFKGI